MFAGMARSRKDAWLRDELILALDLYRCEGRNPPSNAAQGLSDLLRAIPIEPELVDNPQFRNANAVQLKIYNFVSIDPDAETEGMARVGRGDRQVWDEFAADPCACQPRPRASSNRSRRWPPPTRKLTTTLSRRHPRVGC
jgi:hypothetical protein